MTWLITIARNRAIDELRRTPRGVMAPIDDAAHVPDTRPLASDHIDSDRVRDRMRHCLDQLSARDADALREAFIGGSTYADLTQSASVPIGTMKSRIRRALLQLRARMAEIENESSSSQAVLLI